MLLGKHTLSLSTEGRLTLPAEYQQVFDRKGGTLTCGLDHNILLLTKAAFEKMYACLAATSMTDPLARDLGRLILGNALPLESDAGKAIQIPASLTEYAHLQKDVVVVGQGEYLEIWSKEDWATQSERMQKIVQKDQGYEKFNVSLA